MKHSEPYLAAVEIVRKLRDAGFQALWAGGCVRDLLLQKEPKDFDVATNALPEEVRTLFGKRRTLAVGASFGVIIVRGHQPDCDVEIATFRSEGPYLDGRRPEHVRFTTAEEDAQRRDFTINGMFYDPINDSIFDYVGGKADLNQHIIRAIGNPLERMQEDKLRLLRAIRFAATLHFQLEETTRQAVQTMADQINVVSPERIADELRKMLVHPARSQAIALVQETGLLKQVLPELAPLWESAENQDIWLRTLDRLKLVNTHSFETAFATLLLDLPASGAEERLDEIYEICKRLRFSNHSLNLVHWLVQQRNSLEHAPVMKLSRLKRLLAHEDCPHLFELIAADLSSRKLPLDELEFCRQYRDHTPREVLNPHPLISGNDLINLGIKSGPQFKRLLTQIQDAQLEELIHTQDEAFALLSQILQK